MACPENFDTAALAALTSWLKAGSSSTPCCTTRSWSANRGASSLSHLWTARFARARARVLADNHPEDPVFMHAAIRRIAHRLGKEEIDISCDLAAKHGDLAALKACRSLGQAWDANTCRAAARSGRLPVLQWARANGCPWRARTCISGARGGHLAVLQWARESGCPWDTTTCHAASAGDHLAVLQWSRENGWR